MNQTIDGSRQMLVGGDTIPLEDGKIEMPSAQAKTTNIVVEEIEQGNSLNITLSDARADEILSDEQVEILKANRASRVTEKAIARLDGENQI